MSISKLAVAAAALSILTAIAAPASVVGAWKGKLSIDKSKMPPSVTPDQIKSFESHFSKITLMLDLKKDGTFTIKADGVPSQTPAKSQSGTWTLKGNQLTIQAGKGKPQVFTVAKNGKSFSASQFGGVIATFKR